MLDAAIAIITGIIIAAVSSWITVQLSLRRFRSERWWERKAAAYERVIEALHDSKAFSANHLEAGYKFRELSEKVDKELRERSRLAREEIKKSVDIGAFLLSDDALNRLRQFQNDSEEASQEQTWVEYLEADWEATHKCLNDIIQIAKQDLKAK